MLHGIKLAFAARGDKAVLGADQRIQDALSVLTHLHTWFPKLQTAVNENDRLWSSLGSNMQAVSTAAQHMHPDGHPMHFALEALHDAGDSLVHPLHPDWLDAERKRTATELRAFIECLRELRSLQTDVIAALRNKHYYETKVASMHLADARSSKRSERDAEKRERNEQKRDEFRRDVHYLAGKLLAEVDIAVQRKDVVLELALRFFVAKQRFYYARNPLRAVQTRFGAGAMPTPTAGGPAPMHTLSTTLSSTAQDLPLPPRPPSPPNSILSPRGLTNVVTSTSVAGVASLADVRHVVPDDNGQQTRIVARQLSLSDAVDRPGMPRSESTAGVDGDVCGVKNDTCDTGAMAFMASPADGGYDPVATAVATSGGYDSPSPHYARGDMRGGNADRSFMSPMRTDAQASAEMKWNWDCKTDGECDMSDEQLRVYYLGAEEMDRKDANEAKIESGGTSMIGAVHGLRRVVSLRERERELESRESVTGGSTPIATVSGVKAGREGVRLELELHTTKSGEVRVVRSEGYGTPKSGAGGEISREGSLYPQAM